MNSLLNLLKPQKKRESLKLNTFSSVEDAKIYYTEKVRDQLYEEIFFTVRAKCNNCKRKGTFRLFKGTVVNGGECPVCGVEKENGLVLLGLATKRIIYTPQINEEADKLIEEKVNELVEVGLSEGIITRPGDLFS